MRAGCGVSRAAGVVLALALGSSLAACSSSGGGSGRKPAHLANVATPVNGAVASSIDALPLRDTHGDRVTLGSLKGKVVVISDSMTLCSEDCPLDTANVVAAARRTDAAGLSDKVVFLTVTVDPARDTLRRLRAYRAFYAAPTELPNWELLTGTQADLTRLWKYFGVYWKRVPQDTPPDRDWMTHQPLTYDIEHADEVLVLDSRSHERYVISGHARVPDPAAVPSAMRHFLSDAGRQHLDKPDSTTWTPGDVTGVIGKLTDRVIPKA